MTTNAAKDNWLKQCGVGAMTTSTRLWLIGWVFALFAAALYTMDGKWVPVFPALVSIGYFTDAAAEKICERFGK